MDKAPPGLTDGDVVTVSVRGYPLTGTFRTREDGSCVIDVQDSDVLHMAQSLMARSEETQRRLLELLDLYDVNMYKTKQELREANSTITQLRDHVSHLKGEVKYWYQQTQDQ